jgi:hypothetical protein
MRVGARCVASVGFVLDPRSEDGHGVPCPYGLCTQRVQKVPLSQLIRLPPLVTMPLMIVPDQFVVS